MKFEIDITQELSKAWDCTFNDEVLADVEFHYEKAEPMERHYPGCAEAANISSIEATLGEQTHEVFDDLTDDQKALIEEKCIEFYHEGAE